MLRFCLCRVLDPSQVGAGLSRNRGLCHNLSMFKPAVAREIVKKFYTWESFVNDFEDTVEIIMNN